MRSKDHDDEYRVWESVRALLGLLKRYARAAKTRERAVRIARRLKGRLSKLDTDGDILCQEALSLICQVEGDLNGAVQHRERQIGLIRKLHAIALGTPHEGVALEAFGYKALRAGLSTLAALYFGVGEPDKAIAALIESNLIAAHHGKGRGSSYLVGTPGEPTAFLGDYYEHFCPFAFTQSRLGSESHTAPVRALADPGLASRVTMSIDDFGRSMAFGVGGTGTLAMAIFSDPFGKCLRGRPPRVQRRPSKGSWQVVVYQDEPHSGMYRSFRTEAATPGR